MGDEPHKEAGMQLSPDSEISDWVDGDSVPEGYYEAAVVARYLIRDGELVTERVHPPHVGIYRLPPTVSNYEEDR